MAGSPNPLGMLRQQLQAVLLRRVIAVLVLLLVAGVVAGVRMLTHAMSGNNDRVSIATPAAAPHAGSVTATAVNAFMPAVSEPAAPGTHPAAAPAKPANAAVAKPANAAVAKPAPVAANAHPAAPGRPANAAAPAVAPKTAAAAARPGVVMGPVHAPVANAAASAHPAAANAATAAHPVNPVAANAASAKATANLKVVGAPAGGAANAAVANAKGAKAPASARLASVEGSNSPVVTAVTPEAPKVNPQFAHLDDHLTYQYNALGRRDPFQSLVGGGFVGADVGGDAPPDPGGIKVVGIVWGPTDQFAMVEDVRGNSFVLRKGDKVQNGYVDSLRRDGLVVTLTNDGQSQTVVIPLTRKGDQNAR